MQDSRQRESTLSERLNQVAQQQARLRIESNLGPLVDAITESQKQVVAALQKDKKLTLIDNRGVAKPDKFGSKDERFLRWKIRTESFILSVFPELEEPLTWAEEHEASIEKMDVEAEFGSAAVSPVEEIHEKTAQVYAVLQNLHGRRSLHDRAQLPKGQWIGSLEENQQTIRPSDRKQKRITVETYLESCKIKVGRSYSKLGSVVGSDWEIRE